MTYTIIVAQSLNGVIGRDGRMPWHLPTDLSFFRRTTEGHVVIMGRKTFESVGRPLPNRRNLVLSRSPDFSADGVETFSSVQTLKEHIVRTRRPGEDVFVIGGETLYRRFIHEASTIYLTIIDAVVEGDTFFPRLPHRGRVTLLERHDVKPTVPLRGQWFPHRMYRIDVGE